MPDCPTCHQTITPQTVTCPYCRTVLKAHGHPGIPLHRSQTGASLCQSCLYDQDDTCTFPQRPRARECTLYSDMAAQTQAVSPRRGLGWMGAIAWIKAHRTWFLLTGLLGFSLLLALRQRSGR